MSDQEVSCFMPDDAIAVLGEALASQSKAGASLALQAEAI